MLEFIGLVGAIQRLVRCQGFARPTAIGAVGQLKASLIGYAAAMIYCMTSAARPEPPRIPDADPAAIRACLPADVAMEFDRLWRETMDQARDECDLTVVHGFLAQWRITAHAEMTDPGSYFRLLELADQTMADMRAGRRRGTWVSSADIKAMINARLDRR
ncbi:DUF6247 family protein [Nocardia arthritidis]|uniref:Uncharacterized protein n=1 Tax=Nocardia arthritidis TaxID=228602 RepID=A0A6G9YN58_9NOCA|nr:DUF6247 family protein [Nocardia arthritidis]QIS14735.1 hypothetical protein F5544_34510 [Nocardia arthritidis]